MFSQWTKVRGEDYPSETMAGAESVAQATSGEASTSGLVSGEAGAASRGREAVSRSTCCLSDDVRRAGSASWKGCWLKRRKTGSSLSFSPIPSTTQMFG